MSFIVHPLKMAASIATAAVTLALSIFAFSAGRILAGVLNLAIALIFLGILPVFAARVTVDGKGVSRRFLGRASKAMTWDQVAEAGVAGTKVLKKQDSDRTGELYIYFSPVKMSDQERFEMMLKWPPRDKLFMYYTEKRIRAVETTCPVKLEYYNTGKLLVNRRAR